MSIRNQRAFAAGALFLAVAAFYFITSFGYQAGTATNMGPGFFPRMVSILMGAIGLAVMIGAIAPGAHVDKLKRWDLKGIFWITGATILFALLLPYFGIVIAVAAVVILCSIASPEFGWRGTLINTFVLVVFCVGIFIYGINLQIPVWPTLSW